MENFEETFLARWIAGDASVEEINAFEKHEDFQAYLKIKEASKSLSFTKFDEDKALEEIKLKLQTKKKSKVIPLYKWAASIAACALLFFAFVYFNNLQTTYSSDLASMSKVELPDDSEMVLNALSKAKVNTKNWDADRSLSLTGEAFFKVERGATFTVETDLGKVQVLGTQFSVNTINDNSFIVKCYEGSVRVSYDAVEHILTKGMAVQLVNDVESSWTFTERQPIWLVKKETKLHKMPIEQVIVLLKRHYNVAFKNLKVLNLNTVFTGSFTNQNLEEALYSVLGTLGVDYELVNDNEVHLLSK